MQEIVILASGPYLVRGLVPLDHARAVLNFFSFPISWKFSQAYPPKESYALCRCGNTKTPPFCDGTHQQIGFIGKEVADTRPFDETMKIIHGPSLSMKDLKSLCMMANFCNINRNVWNQIEKPLNEKQYQKTLKAIQQCPSGRLVPIDTKSGEILEPSHEPSISIIEEHGYTSQGAIWVKGGIQIISSNGLPYEIRNRVTLCRCGQSSNMPFCDGRHLLNPPQE
jgi:CDGSH-type Zn-finger protein